MNLTYTVYKGRYQREPQYDTIKAVTRGKTATLTASVSRIPNEFLVRYTGTLRVSEPGEYRFSLGAAGGNGGLRINNQPVLLPGNPAAARGRVVLPKGDLPVDLFYAKFRGSAQPASSLTLTGPGIREFTLGEVVGDNVEEVDPIMVEASTNTILRSFIDVPGVGTGSPGTANPRTAPVRVVHAVSVGSPEQVHYSYDLDKGAVIHVWRGQFLDATPMWHDRGNGVSRPMGVVNS